MPWFQVDDQLGFHPKAITAGNAAMGLWVRAGSWCSLHITGGFVPTNIARSIGTPAQIKRLTESGLWMAVDGGYEFHQWGDRQLSKDEIEVRRQKRADAGRKGGQKSGESRRGGSKSGSKPEAEDEANPSALAEAVATSGLEQMPTPVLVPVPDGGYLSGGSLVANAHENDPPPPHCENHPGGTPEPCGACATARRRWVATKLERDEQAEREAAERAELERQVKLQTASDRAAEIRQCRMCDPDGFIEPTILCTHDPAEAERAERGMAGVREAMGWKTGQS